MDNRPIGVFDSGLGGLTCVKELMHVLPGENIIYLGDTGRVPYGTRSKETIIQYALEGVAFLEKFDVKHIIIACGTVSTVAMDQVKRHAKVPTMGVLEVAPQRPRPLPETKNRRDRNAGHHAQPGLPQPAAAADPGVSVYAKACPSLCRWLRTGILKTTTR